jgi:hypothetical protein
MGYSPRITIEDYVMAMLRNDSAKLAPRKPGCYTVWLADFRGSEPQTSDKIVYVGKTEAGDAELLFRVAQLVLDAIGITGKGTVSSSKHSFFHSGGREIFLKHGNAKARDLLVGWRDDGCPSCGEYRIYQMFSNSAGLLNRKKVSLCHKRH